MSLRALQEYTKARRDAAANHRTTDTARLLVLDSLIFQTEAEVRWLDLCEARITQLTARPPSRGVPAGATRNAETQPFSAPPAARRPRPRLAQSNIHGPRRLSNGAISEWITLRLGFSRRRHGQQAGGRPDSMAAGG